MTGEKFLRQLLEPIDLNTILLLTLSGWEMDDILRVFANRINGMPNAPTAGDSTPEGTPEYEELLEVVEALDELEDVGGVTIAAAEDEELNELVIGVLPKWAEMRNIKSWFRS